MNKQYHLTCFGVDFAVPEENPGLIIKTVMTHFRAFDILGTLENVIDGGEKTASYIPDGLIRMRFPTDSPYSHILDVNLIERTATATERDDHPPESYEQRVLVKIVSILNGYFSEAKEITDL